VIAWIAYALVFNLAHMFLRFDPRHMGAGLVAQGINPITALANSIVNPLFEETFVTGYIVSTLKQHGSPRLGVNLSIAVRLLYHLYQGPFAVISIVPIGLIFAAWYCRSGRLWPLIVAHGIFDFIALMSVQ
jgi:membrane protease YdiL (CAAX protease family)